MMRNHKGDNTAEGDLADDMYLDKEKFPRNSSCKFKGWHDLIKDYLHRQGACSECVSVFEQCWREYETNERKRLRMRMIP
jgi:uncharacterized protein YozE (UPF0346 family)